MSLCDWAIVVCEVVGRRRLVVLRHTFSSALTMEDSSSAGIILPLTDSEKTKVSDSGISTHRIVHTTCHKEWNVSQTHKDVYQAPTGEQTSPLSWTTLTINKHVCVFSDCPTNPPFITFHHHHTLAAQPQHSCRFLHWIVALNGRQEGGKKAFHPHLSQLSDAQLLCLPLRRSQVKLSTRGVGAYTQNYRTCTQVQGQHANSAQSNPWQIGWNFKG